VRAQRPAPGARRVLSSRRESARLGVPGGCSSAARCPAGAQRSIAGLTAPRPARRLHGTLGSTFNFTTFKWVDGSSPGDGTPSSLVELNQTGYSHCESSLLLMGCKLSVGRTRPHARNARQPSHSPCLAPPQGVDRRQRTSQAAPAAAWRQPQASPCSWASDQPNETGPAPGGACPALRRAPCLTDMKWLGPVAGHWWQLQPLCNLGTEPPPAALPRCRWLCAILLLPGRCPGGRAQDAGQLRDLDQHHAKPAALGDIFLQCRPSIHLRVHRCVQQPWCLLALVPGSFCAYRKHHNTPPAEWRPPWHLFVSDLLVTDTCCPAGEVVLLPLQ
jgi:hypothetical protein